VFQAVASVRQPDRLLDAIVAVGHRLKQRRR